MSNRPLECECNKPIKVHYTTIVGDKTSPKTSQVHMCADCPVLQRKLYGSSETAPVGSSLGVGAGLCCGNCGTMLEAVRRGQPVGCYECYEVFADIFVQEMFAAKKIYKTETKISHAMPLHVGRAPGESTQLSISTRLLALHDALNETLSKEDYEQAAWLRDQIKSLTEKDNGEEEAPQK